MSHPFPTQGLYCLTDSQLGAGRSHFEQARLFIEGGARIVQLRDKTTPRESLVSEAQEIAALCREGGAVFIVNDDPELAAEAGAAGVHLGQEDRGVEEARRIVGPDAIMGLSTHTREQVLAAADLPVDYIGFGPIFATGTKATGYSPRGVAELGWAIKHSAWPVVPIGGIGIDNLPELLEVGARHAAVVSSVLAAPDVAAAVRAMADLLEG